MNKKLKFVWAAMISVLVFGGCSLGGLFKSDPDAKSLEGVLEEQSGNFKGTHTLTMDDDEVILLRSLSINLSSSQYLGNEVQVLGSYGEDGVFEVTGVSVMERLDKNQAPRHFISYKNTDLGFQMKYYDDWKVKEDGDTVTFLAPSATETEDVDKVVITQEQFLFERSIFDTEGKATPLSDYFARNFPQVNNFDELKREVGPDRMEAVLMEDQFGNMDYYLYRNGLIYQISYIPASENSVVENKNIFKQMVSEFQFTGFTVDKDQPDTDSQPEGSDLDQSIGSSEKDLDYELVSFESLPYEFVGKYPKNWYYAGVRSTESGVLHHYGFSDESIEDGNEIISLDVLAEAKSGNTTSGGVMTIYTTVDGRTYRLKGPTSYRDLIEAMAEAIESKKSE